MANVKVSVAALRPGDKLCGTGRIVKCVSAGVRTPSGKMEVITEHPAKPDSRRCDVWNRRTIVTVEREG